MAGNTKCYRVTVGADGNLQAEMVEFSPRFADSVAQAVERLKHRDTLGAPHVRFGDWPALQKAWAERGEVTP